MTWYAQYNLTTGAITGTSNQPLSGGALSILAAKGLGQIKIPDGIDGGTHKINLDTMQVEELPPPPPPPLGILDHLFIAAVNRGDIDLNEVNASILEPLNTSLQYYGKPILSVK